MDTLYYYNYANFNMRSRIKLKKIYIINNLGWYYFEKKNIKNICICYYYK